jgi:hypothetical protein
MMIKSWNRRDNPIFGLYKEYNTSVLFLVSSWPTPSILVFSTPAEALGDRQADRHDADGAPVEYQ